MARHAFLDHQGPIAFELRNLPANVTATKGTLTTHAAIAQTNVVAATSAATTSSTLGAFVATHVAVVSAVAGSVVAAGVVTGVVVATRTSPTSITTGTGAVGAPQFVKHF